MEKIGTENLKDTNLVEKRAKEVFAEIDSDGNGKIDGPELKQAMSRMGVTLKTKEVEFMIKEADEDGDMLVDQDEFVNLIKTEVVNYQQVASAACNIQ